MNVRVGYTNVNLSPVAAPLLHGILTGRVSPENLRRAGWLCDMGNIVWSGSLSWPYAKRHRLDALCSAGLWYGLLAGQRFRRLQKL